MTESFAEVWRGRVRCCGEHLAQTVADEMAAVIATSLAEKESADIALAGGGTPADCYRLLSERDLDWRRVTVAPTDERCVPPSHPRSNRRMIKETLMREGSPAAHARLATLDGDYIAPPFDLMLLGMGEDLHIASLFPSSAADEKRGGEKNSTVRVISPDGEERISLTMSALLASRRIFLMFSGDKKKRALAAAPSHSPAARLLTSAPVQIFCD